MPLLGSLRSGSGDNRFEWARGRWAGMRGPGAGGPGELFMEWERRQPRVVRWRGRIGDDSLSWAPREAGSEWDVWGDGRGSSVFGGRGESQRKRKEEAAASFARAAGRLCPVPKDPCAMGRVRAGRTRCSLGDLTLMLSSDTC